MDDFDNTNRYFKGQQSDENIACFYRKHWIVLIPLFCGVTVFIAIILLIFAVLSSKIILFLREQEAFLSVLLILTAILTTFYINYFFIKLINYFLEVLVVTNYRIIELRKTLYINHDRDAIDLSKMQDVIKKQNGLIKNILNYGEIIITLSGASINKTLKYTPNPEYFFRKIYDLKREYIVKRSSGKREQGLDLPKNENDFVVEQQV